MSIKLLRREVEKQEGFIALGNEDAGVHLSTSLARRTLLEIERLELEVQFLVLDNSRFRQTLAYFTDLRSEDDAASMARKALYPELES